MLYSKLTAQCRTRKGPGGDEVVIPESLFKALLLAALESVEVNEHWYLEQNPDVRESVRDGRIASARKHFITQGYVEGRLPHAITVDEEYYADSNPDLREALHKGAIRSLAQHFLETGRFEGRAPSANFSLFGSGSNLKDE
jgi:hypothetical protein